MAHSSSEHKVPHQQPLEYYFQIIEKKALKRMASKRAIFGKIQEASFKTRTTSNIEEGEPLEGEQLIGEFPKLHDIMNVSFDEKANLVFRCRFAENVNGRQELFGKYVQAASTPYWPSMRTKEARKLIVHFSRNVVTEAEMIMFDPGYTKILQEENQA
jgi:hypothetical protein